MTDDENTPAATAPDDGQVRYTRADLERARGGAWAQVRREFKAREAEVIAPVAPEVIDAEFETIEPVTPVPATPARSSRRVADLDPTELADAFRREGRLAVLQRHLDEVREWIRANPVTGLRRR